MVSQVVLLDSGPLGLMTNPKLSPQGVACAKWLQSLMTERTRVIVPEIADYEVRRELLRANKTKGVARLDALNDRLEYLPITTRSMRQAARYWAQARQQGQPTAGDKTIDADMILVAQAKTLDAPDVDRGFVRPGSDVRRGLSGLDLGSGLVPTSGRPSGSGAASRCTVSTMDDFRNSSASRLLMSASV